MIIALIAIAGVLVYLTLFKKNGVDKWLKRQLGKIPGIEPEEPEGEPNPEEPPKPPSTCQDFVRTRVTIAVNPFQPINPIATVNRNYAEKFQELASYIQLNNINELITRVDSFNCRKIAGSASWSYHSYGQAIDINPEEFPMVNKEDEYPLPQWLLTLADVWRNIGGRWGGDWNTKFDPMHFEIGEPIPR